MSFPLYLDKLKEQSYEIYEALDCDTSENADYFQEKIQKISGDILFLLRDPRKGNENRTLMHNAARNGNVAAVLYLIKIGYPVDCIDSPHSKITPLMDAILMKHTDIIVILVEAGANIFNRDINGENSFHYLARSGNCRALRNLLNIATSSFNSNYSHVSDHLSLAKRSITRDEIIELASTLSIKKKLPEDLASNSIIKNILIGLRENGYKSYGLH